MAERRDGRAGAEWSRARAFRPLMVAAGFCMAMTAPLELLYARRLGAGAVALTVYIAAPASTMLAVDLLGTRLVPRLDARAVLAIGIGLFGTSCGALGASPSFLPLIPFRAFQGLAAGLVLGAGLQAAVRTDPMKERALAGFSGAFLLGAALGAPSGGALAGLFPGAAGFRVAFGLCAALCLIVAFCLIRHLPRLPPPANFGKPCLGLPHRFGQSGIGPALLLGMLGDFLRGGVVYTAIPLVGQARHLSTATIGLAVGLLSAVEIATLRLSGRAFGRFGVLPCLVGALGSGIATSAALALAEGRSAFLAGAFLFGVVVAGATVAPQLVIVALSDDPATGLASYRISSGVGMLIGSAGAGAAIAALGPSGLFVVVGAVLVGGMALTYGVGRKLAAGAPSTKH